MTSSELKSLARDKVSAMPKHILIFIIPILWLIFSQLNNSQHAMNVAKQLQDPAAYAAQSAPIGLLTNLGSTLILVISIAVSLIKQGAQISQLRFFRKESSLAESEIDMFYVFKSGHLSKYLLTFALTSVFFLLWSLLGIPIALLVVIVGSLTKSLGFTILLGLVATIAFLYLLINRGLGYAQVNYVVFDQIQQDTYQGPLAVIRLSQAMMKGQKLRLFKLYLSFIGWFILSCLTCHILQVYFMPYIEMAKVAFYEDIQNKSFNS